MNIYFFYTQKIELVRQVRQQLINTHYNKHKTLYLMKNVSEQYNRTHSIIFYI